MSRKPKVANVEALGIIDAAGKLADIFPAGLKHRYDASQPGDRMVKFVPFDPDAARVLRLVERFLRGNLFDESSVAALRDLRIAVERRQKRGAK